MKTRPTGVIILGFMNILSAISAIPMGFVVWFCAGAIMKWLGAGTISSGFLGFGLALAVWLLGGFSFLVGRGLLRLQNWARYWVVFSCGLGLMFNVFGPGSFSIWGLLMSCGIIWYLAVNPRVKDAFHSSY